MNLMELFVKIGVDQTELTAGLNQAQGKVQDFSSSLSSFGSNALVAGTTLNGVSRAAQGLYQNILDAGMGFEAGMDQVRAISGLSEEEMIRLEEKAMEMAQKTKYTTEETADAYKYMAMAGWKAEQMYSALDAVMYLAGASGEDLGKTSDIVTDAMTAFGLSAEGTSKVLKDGYEVEVSNAQRFTDVLSAASNNANTNVNMLGESFKFIAPVAGTMGYALEDVAIALGLMANNGIKASMGGTAMRNLLVNMAKPSQTMETAMKRLGVSLDDGAGNMYSLLDILKQLRASFKGVKFDTEEYERITEKLNTQLANGEITEEEYAEQFENYAACLLQAADAQKANLAASLAGKYGMAGLLAIVSSTDEDFDKLTKAIYNSNGATEEMYDIMTDNAKGAVTRLNSALDVLYTSLSKKIIPIFTDLVEKVTDVVNWFGSLDDNTQKAILGMVGAVAVLSPLLITIGKVITAVGAIGNLFSGLIGAFGNVTKVASGASKAIAGIGTAATNAGPVVSGGIGTITKLFGGIGAVISGAVMAVTSFVSMFINGFSLVKEAIMVVGIALTAVGAIILGAPAAVAGAVRLLWQL